jgi:hypothetical protein
MNSKTFAFVGGLVGLGVFLVVGLLPSIVYGGFAGTVLASSILGEPLSGQIISRLLIAFGMLVGLLATGGVFVVIGSALGAGVHALAHSPKALLKKKV